MQYFQKRFADHDRVLYAEGVSDPEEAAALVGRYLREARPSLARGAQDALFISARGRRLDTSTLRRLVASLADPEVAYVCGRLELRGTDGANKEGVYWRYENWIRRQESRFRGVVGMSGAIAMMRKSELDRMPEDLILDDVWIPMRLALTG